MSVLAEASHEMDEDEMGEVDEDTEVQKMLVDESKDDNMEAGDLGH